MIEMNCICRCGQVRAVNQDRAGCFSCDDWCIGFVADGMGGHYAGEQASEIVSQACTQWWNAFLRADQRPGFLQSIEQLRTMLAQCHDKIGAITPSNEICGTTLVLLWLWGEEYAIFSVGDSRCYQIERRMGAAGRPKQLTHDDVSSEPAAAGKLLRALGAGSYSISVQTGRLPAKALYALCSDGIYKYYPGLLRELRRVRPYTPLAEASNKICTQVEQAGAPDNYSLVLIRRQ